MIVPVSHLRPPKPAAPAMAAPAAPGLNGGANRFAAGAKSYGPGAIGTATSGAVDKTGYLERDQKRKMRQLAMQNMSLPLATPSTLGSAV